MANRVAEYFTVGDSCGECGANLKEIKDGPNKGDLFCLDCTYDLPDEEFVETMEGLLNYEEDKE